MLKRWLSNNSVSRNLLNRNPRNLERLRVGYKPDGYHVETLGLRFWHKLQLKSSGKYVTATITHFTNTTKPVLQVSTHEWSIKSQLYRYNDSSAYVNLGRVLAERCLHCSLTEMYCDVKHHSADTKEGLFLQALRDGGIKLNETDQYKAVRSWDEHRKPEKPWEDLDQIK